MEPIKVVFLGLYFEAWDALDEIYQKMAKDPRFEPIVVSMPRKLTGQLAYAQEEKAHAFFKSRQIPHIRLNSGGSGSQNKDGLAVLQDLAPDYVFVNYPWQRNYQPALRFDHLVEFTRLVYVPYFSLVMVDEPDDEPGGGQGDAPVATHLFTQRLHQLASLVFTQERDVVEAYALTERGNAHVHFTGSPKIDNLAREAQTGASSWPLEKGKFKIIWAPHHSYSPHWYNFGVFSKIYKQMLEFARANSDIQIVLRPHPFLWSTLTDRKVIEAEELSSWKKTWSELPNTAIDEKGSYAGLFLATDILVTDGISFLGEYPLVTGKPAIFFENSDHWKFSATGEIAAASSIRVNNFAELTEMIELAKNGSLPDRKQEIQKLVEASSPHPGESASRIIEIVYQDFINGPSPLVSKEAIKATPWELAAGREPFAD
jgi:CDP-glycerol glycerophosphotransferase (TagB/SpsB family)